MHSCQLCGSTLFTQKVSGRRLNLEGETYEIPTIKDGLICGECFEEMKLSPEMKSFCNLCHKTYPTYSDMYPPEVSLRCSHLLEGKYLRDQFEYGGRDYLVKIPDELDLQEREYACRTCLSELESQGVIE